MPSHIVRSDIAKMHADTIVNTANYSPTIGVAQIRASI